MLFEGWFKKFRQLSTFLSTFFSSQQSYFKICGFLVLRILSTTGSEYCGFWVLRFLSTAVFEYCGFWVLRILSTITCMRCSKLTFERYTYFSKRAMIYRSIHVPVKKYILSPPLFYLIIWLLLRGSFTESWFRRKAINFSRKSYNRYCFFVFFKFSFNFFLKSTSIRIMSRIWADVNMTCNMQDCWIYYDMHLPPSHCPRIICMWCKTLVLDRKWLMIIWQFLLTTLFREVPFMNLWKIGIVILKFG